MDTNRNYEIGMYLRRLRKQNHLTLEEVAKKMEVTTMTIYNYELGKRDLKVTILEKIAPIYHTTVNQILIDSKIQ